MHTELGHTRMKSESKVSSPLEILQKPELKEFGIILLSLRRLSKLYDLPIAQLIAQRETDIQFDLASFSHITISGTEIKKSASAIEELIGSYCELTKRYISHRDDHPEIFETISRYIYYNFIPSESDNTQKQEKKLNKYVTNLSWILIHVRKQDAKATIIPNSVQDVTDAFSTFELFDTINNLDHTTKTILTLLSQGHTPEELQATGIAVSLDQIQAARQTLKNELFFEEPIETQHAPSMNDSQTGRRLRISDEKEAFFIFARNIPLPQLISLIDCLPVGQEKAVLLQLCGYLPYRTTAEYMIATTSTKDAFIYDVASGVNYLKRNTTITAVTAPREIKEIVDSLLFERIDRRTLHESAYRNELVSLLSADPSLLQQIRSITDSSETNYRMVIDYIISHPEKNLKDIATVFNITSSNIFYIVKSTLLEITSGTIITSNGRKINRDSDHGYLITHPISQTDISLLTAEEQKIYDYMTTSVRGGYPSLKGIAHALHIDKRKIFSFVKQLANIQKKNTLRAPF